MFHCNLFFRLSALIRIKINDEQGQAIPIKPVDDKGKQILSNPSLILPCIINSILLVLLPHLENTMRKQRYLAGSKTVWRKHCLPPLAKQPGKGIPYVLKKL